MFVFSGCDSKDDFVVLCGSSFVRPAEELCRRFTKDTGIEISTTAAGSEDFLPLVQAGKVGDILDMASRWSPIMPAARCFYPK